MIMQRCDFRYQLPPELIAQIPPATRSGGRMLVVDPAADGVRDARVVELPGELQAGDLLVLNDTRVIRARLHGKAHPGPFKYKNFGTLATIGRKRAVVDFGWTQLKGFPAWFLWSTAHLYFLVGFRNRLAVFLQWMYSYFTWRRGARIITR